MGAVITESGVSLLFCLHFFFCFIVVIWFCRWLVCRAFNFHPLFSMPRLLFLTVLHSVVSRESRDSVIHPSDLLWVWIPLPHPPYCLPFDLYHTCKHALCNFPFHDSFNLKNPAALNYFTTVGSFFSCGSGGTEAPRMIASTFLLLPFWKARKCAN